ncbi:MAG: hypothetical protein HUU50_10555 [Candidatus Brocadiae bacterium]|nr:hypothetical protein [Candidatus Brocadiia bacterium]
METTIYARKAEWIGLFGLILSFLFSCLIFLIAYFCQSEAIYIEGWHLFFGTFLWLLLILHSRQKRMAAEEEMFSPKENVSSEKSLFEGEGDDPFSARTGLAFLEKWVVPFSTLFLGIAFIVVGAFLFMRLIKQGERPSIQNAPLSAAFLGGFAFFSLLFAKYSLGMSRQKQWRSLRAGGSYLFMNAVVCFLGCVSLALYNLEIAWPEKYLAYSIPLLMAILGIEMLLNLLLDIYRPRIAGQEVHPPYDSRFLDLCAGSKSLLKTAAHTLDYQFGFKVSETWFYRFLEKAILPLLVFQFLALYLIHCIVIVHPEDQAVLERFGRPLENQILQPGIHFKWPWPIDKVYHYPTGRILTLKVPEDHEEETPSKKHVHSHSHGKEHKEEHKKEILLFTKEHGHQDDYFLVAHETTDKNSAESVPVNLLAVDAILQYRIQNILDYSYRHAYPDHLLEGIAFRELTCFLASTNMKDLLSTRRLEICKELQQKIQARCDQHRLGIQMVAFLICNVHPPVETSAEFEAVLGAMEQKETKILEADKYKNQILPLAQAQAEEMIIQAKTYLAEKEMQTSAQAKAFENYSQAYSKGNTLYILRKYLKILEQNLQEHRLYIIDVKDTQKEVNILNLEEKLSSDLLQLDFNHKEENK